MTAREKWADMTDDDINVDELAFVQTDGDIKSASTFVSQADGVWKVTTKSRIRKQINRESNTQRELRNRLRQLRTKIELPGTGEECSIELPKNLRKADDDEDLLAALEPSYREPGLSIGLRKDTVREKFNMIRRMDGILDGLDKDGDDYPLLDDNEDDMKHRSVFMNGRRDQQHREDCTVRVTNLSEQTQERDVIELFQGVGKVSRIYLAKNKETKSSKGFAFVTFESRHHAEKAIRLLDRHGYDNLLIKVEWAKPALKSRE